MLVSGNTNLRPWLECRFLQQPLSLASQLTAHHHSAAERTVQREDMRCMERALPPELANFPYQLPTA